MTIYYRPAIYHADLGYADHVFYLPVPIGQWSEDLQVSHGTRVVPLVAGQTRLWSQARGVNITLSGTIIGAAQADLAYSTSATISSENSRTIARQLQAALSNPGFRLYRWHDRYWDNCICKSVSIKWDSSPGHAVPWSAQIEALDPDEVTGNSISAGWWETWVGDAQTGGTIEEATVPYHTIPFTFNGVVTLNDQLILQVGATAATSCHVVKIGIMGVDGKALGGASGDTTFTCATSSLGSGIDVTIDETEETATYPTGTSFASPGIAFTAGTDSLYIHASSASGGHQNARGYIIVSEG